MPIRESLFERLTECAINTADGSKVQAEIQPCITALVAEMKTAVDSNAKTSICELKEEFKAISEYCSQHPECFKDVSLHELNETPEEIVDERPNQKDAVIPLTILNIQNQAIASMVARTLPVPAKSERMQSLRDKFQSLVDATMELEIQDVEDEIDLEFSSSKKNLTKDIEQPQEVEIDIQSDAPSPEDKREDAEETLPLDPSEIFLLDDYIPVPTEANDYAVIDIWKNELEQDVIPAYESDFATQVPLHELLVASVPVEQIERRERQIEQSRVDKAKVEAEIYRQRELAFLRREKQLGETFDEKQHMIELKMEQRQAEQYKRMAHQKVHLTHLFHQAEVHMSNVLAKQHAHVEKTFGTLEPSSSEKPTTTSDGGTKYRVEWHKIPQPVHIRCYLMRAIKDKLPLGHYCILVTLYDRLGGHPLTWSVLGDDTRQRSVTKPYFHKGRFFDTEWHINQDVVSICPSPEDLRPANVFIFELYLLQGKYSSHDQVVGWSCLPMTSPNFEIVRGQFRIPFLRGEMDLSLDKSEDIEALYRADLSSWLGNFYVEISPLPRECIDQANGSVFQREFDVEMDWNNDRLQLRGQVRAQMAQAETQETKEVDRTDLDLEEAKEFYNNLPKLSNASSSPNFLQQSHNEEEKEENESEPLLSRTSSSPLSSSSLRLRHPSLKYKEKPKELPIESSKSSKWKMKKPSLLSRFQKKGQALMPNRFSSKKEDGLFKLEEDAEDDDERAVDQMSPYIVAPSRSVPKCTATELVQSKQLEQFRFSVNHELEEESAIFRRFQSHRKLRYLRQELFADFNPKKASCSQLCQTIALVFFTSWIRLYFHYFGQWLYLRSIYVPVYDFRPQFFSTIIKYTAQSVPVHIEVMVIVIGHCSVVGFFGLLIAIEYASLKVLHVFPTIASRVVVSFGLMTILDPLLCLLVDLIQHNYNCRSVSDACARGKLSMLFSCCFFQTRKILTFLVVDLADIACRCIEGDAFKLYSRFNWEEGSGVVGIVLYIILTLVLMTFCIILFYHYVLHLHCNGRMLDVYMRIHQHQDAFFLPHDFEMPQKEVEWICDKAKRWIGAKGQKRRVAVCDYELRDPLDLKFVETTTHIAIYNVNLDGVRQLYRHFIQNPDGTMMEIFGDLALNFGAQYHALEQLLLSDLAETEDRMKDNTGDVVSDEEDMEDISERDLYTYDE